MTSAGLFYTPTTPYPVAPGSNREQIFYMSGAAQIAKVTFASVVDDGDLGATMVTPLLPSSPGVAPLPTAYNAPDASRDLRHHVHGGLHGDGANVLDDLVLPAGGAPYPAPLHGWRVGRCDDQRRRDDVHGLRRGHEPVTLCPRHDRIPPLE